MTVGSMYKIKEEKYKDERPAADRRNDFEELYEQEYDSVGGL